MFPLEKLPTLVDNNIAKLVNLGGWQSETYHQDLLQHIHSTTIAGNRSSLQRSRPSRYYLPNTNPQKTSTKNIDSQPHYFRLAMKTALKSLESFITSLIVTPEDNFKT
jgi:hypothetical protein